MPGPRVLRRSSSGTFRGCLSWVLAGLVAPVVFGQTPDGVDVADLGGLETRSAALILSGQEAGDLETAVLAIPVPGPPGTEGPVRVALVVDVDGGSLLAGAEGDYLVTEVYAYAVDAGGGLGGTLTQAFRIDLGRHRVTLDGGGVKFLGHLDLAPGSYSLRTLVLHRQSGRLRVNIDDLSVPAPQERLVLPPLFPEPADRWLVVREKSDVDLPFPRTSDGRAWVPATRPGAADQTGLYLAGRGLEGGLRAHVVDGENGEILSELGLGDLRPVDGSPSDLEMVAAEIRLGGLSGRHRLRISSADGTAEASITLRIGTSGGERAILAELDGAPVETATGGRQTAVAKGRALVELLGRTDAAYRRALGHLSVGDTTRAMTEIIDLERAGIGERLGDETPQVQEQLKNAQVTVAAKLAGRRVEGLVAWLSLHERLYRRYHENRHVFLASHTRQVLTGIGDLYIQRSRAPEAERLVASAVASVGGYFHELGAESAAEEIYLQALDYDGGHPTALLAKAMVHERASHYEKAEELLRKLVASDSGDRRAKLHLAVVQRRHAPRKALKLLEECTQDETADWITALAYQELANLHADENRLQDAIRVLREGLEKMSGEQALYLQLSALLDRAGMPGRATEVLKRLDARATGSAASPRYIYGLPPSSDFVRNRRILAAAAERRRPILAEIVNHLATAEAAVATASNPGGP